MRCEVLIAMALLCSAALADDASLRSRVDRELKPALARLESENAQAVGSVIVTGTARFGSKKIAGPNGVKEIPNIVVQTPATYTFSHDGLDNKEARVYPKKDGSKMELIRVQAQGHQFMLNRALPDGKYLLNGRSAEVKNADYPLGFESWKLVSASFGVEGYAFTKIMEHPSFLIRNVSSAVNRGVNCVKIEYDFDGTKSPKIPIPLGGGWIIVSPESRWAIQESSYIYGNKSKDKIHAVVNYSEKTYNGGVPIPSEVTVERPNGIKRIYKVDHIEFKKPADREFTLAYYQLPDIGKPVSARTGSKWPTIFIVLAILALIVSISLKIWADRRSKAASAT